jgi:hypothetical protein
VSSSLLLAAQACLLPRGIVIVGDTQEHTQQCWLGSLRNRHHSQSLYRGRLLVVRFHTLTIHSALRQPLLFLPSLRTPRLIEQWAIFDERSAVDSVHTDEAQRIRNDTERAALKFFGEVVRRGGWIVLEDPMPVLLFVAMRCSDWFNKHNPICARGPNTPRTLSEALRAPVFDSYARIRAALPGVVDWDPLPILCTGTDCSAYRDDKPLFTDGDHLSAYANDILFPQFSAFLSTLSTNGPERGPR